MSQLRNFVNIVNSEVRIQSYKYTIDIAKSMAAEAVEILESQRYSWKPLTDKYFDSKLKRGLDTRTLIATGFYQDHITWGQRDDGSIWVGVEDVIHEPSGMRLVKLARIHEFGTATIPARPLWRPLLSKYIRQSEQFAVRYRKEVNRAAARAKSNMKSRKVKVKL